MKKLFAILLSAWGLTINSIAQQTPSFVKDSLDIYIQRGMSNWQIPGVAILIVKDGKVVFQKGYGTRETGKDKKVDENTLFMIGSNTKAFTGTALAILEAEGQLKLEDKVIKYLPDFRMKDSWVNNELNLLDIVSHRIGMETFQGDFIYWTSNLTSDEIIEKFGQLTPKYDFRTKYGYTNAGYVVAGKVIETVSGLRWEDYVKEKILKPLKMDRTVVLSVDFNKSENTAKPHTVLDERLLVLPFENLDNMAPCGTISSSITDLSHWVMAQLDSGNYIDELAIPYSAIQKTRELLSIERRVHHPYNRTHYGLYGMGWGLQDYEGREIISHTGGVNGFVTSVTLMPEEKLGIVVLTNTDQNALFVSSMWEILDAYLGLPYRNYDSSFYAGYLKKKVQKDEWLKAISDSATMNFYSDVDLSEFEGKYKNEVYGSSWLVRKGNFLEMTLQHHPKITGKLEYIGNNRFFCTYSDPIFGKKVFQFAVESDKVKSFDLYVDDFIDYEPYKFVKQ